jgi:hypothetical protein
MLLALTSSSFRLTNTEHLIFVINYFFSVNTFHTFKSDWILQEKEGKSLRSLRDNWLSTLLNPTSLEAILLRGAQFRQLQRYWGSSLQMACSQFFLKLFPKPTHMRRYRTHAGIRWGALSYWDQNNMDHDLTLNACNTSLSKKHMAISCLM